ncbi:MAG TPA: LysR family transcriptional regulator [Firmicutes bacterium]|jgi:DNA-binding transcriptional LysR family regulator|nr:LysR family transcriptional regulator [Bacillota bacterium]
MDINFDLYKVFYQVATSASFSDAAAKLFISQSAVSQAIKNLEQRLGSPLFMRQTRHLQLTQEGELLLSHVGQAYNLIKIAESKLSEMQNLETGMIRIGASDTVCRYYLLPFLEHFSLNYPKIKIQFLNRTSPQLIEALRDGMIDFAIVTLPVNEENLAVQELIKVEDVLVSANRFPSLKDHKVSWDELSQYPLLLLEKNSATRRNFDNYLKRQGIRIVPEIELESVELLVEFAKIGLGIAHVVKESVLQSIKKGQLFLVETQQPLPPRQLGIITSKNRSLSQAGKKFIAQLTDDITGKTE